MGAALLAVALVVLVICLLAAWCLQARRRVRRAAAGADGVRGGASRKRPDPARSPHLVVDTLNITHWLNASKEGAPLSLTPELIADTIDRTAADLKKHHPGRVVYVIKDRESQFNTEPTRKLYQAAAVRNGVSIAVVERYVDPPQGVKPSSEHSSLGRDDFYMSLIAHRYRCAVLTADSLKDFSRFRATIPPFHVYEYSYWRDLPHRDFIRPEAIAFAQLRRPRRIPPQDLLAPVRRRAGPAS